MTYALKPFQMDRKTAMEYLSVGEAVFKKQYHPLLKHMRNGKAYLYLTADIEKLATKMHQQAQQEQASASAPIKAGKVRNIQVVDDQVNAFDQALKKARAAGR